MSVDHTEPLIDISGDGRDLLDVTGKVEENLEERTYPAGSTRTNASNRLASCPHAQLLCVVRYCSFASVILVLRLYVYIDLQR